MGNRNVPVQVPPCQMLNTAMPVSAYQLRRMLRELPRTSKKTSPSRGSGAASDTDMLAMVTPSRTVVQFVQSIARRPRAWPSRGGRSGPLRAPACRGRSPRPGSRKIFSRRTAKKCRPAVRGRQAGWHHGPQAFPAPVFRGAPSFGTPSFGSTVWGGRRLSRTSLRLPASSVRSDVFARKHARTTREQYDAMRR